MKRKYYTIYSNESDEIIAFGSAEDCRKKLGYKNLEQFYAFVSKTRSGYRKTCTVVTEIIDEDE